MLIYLIIKNKNKRIETKQNKLELVKWIIVCFNKKLTEQKQQQQHKSTLMSFSSFLLSFFLFLYLLIFIMIIFKTLINNTFNIILLI
jgi:hypothetical protein